MKQTKKLLNRVLFFLLIFVVGDAAAQKKDVQSMLEEGSVEEQFNFILDNSSTYNDYKAIKSSTIYALKKNVFDTLKSMRTDAALKQKTIFANNGTIDSLTDNLETTREELALAVKEKNAMQFLGIKMGKSVYNTLMWLLTGVLAFSLGLFVLLYKRSNAVTVQALHDLEETRDEFEKHRKRALERQEEVVRKYHAELNKYKNKSHPSRSGL